MTLLILFAGASSGGAPPAPVVSHDHAAVVRFRDKRTAVEFRDKRQPVKFRDKRTKGSH